jgi:hypothetical protein
MSFSAARGDELFERRRRLAATALLIMSVVAMLK